MSQINEVRAAAYPVVPAAEARARADRVVDEVGLESDVGLEERLIAVLRGSMPDAAVSALVHEAKQLYFLLHDPARAEEHKPVNAPALSRSLVLAMSRPAEDPCWQDYQNIVAAIESRWAKASAEYGPHPIRALRRALTRTTPTRAELEATWLQPISDARRHFVATWRDC